MAITGDPSFVTFKVSPLAKVHQTLRRFLEVKNPLQKAGGAFSGSRTGNRGAWLKNGQEEWNQNLKKHTLLGGSQNKKDQLPEPQGQPFISMDGFQLDDGSQIFEIENGWKFHHFHSLK